MNKILQKILFYLSVLAFGLTVFASYHAGASLLQCMVRGAIALVVVGFFTSYVVRGVMREIAFELSEHEERIKREEEREQLEKRRQYDEEAERMAEQQENESIDDEDEDNEFIGEDE